ncbi:MAG: 50S ribosomal protein L23 [Candidatus Marinimicrobia bacterium]|jgi:large subunit ribosomal protein L23|nr:50S ribosomal protein L23 [Candidatus Neomarinimicrobiota bacterium]MBT4064264.1 50S ribosomal protein L23 [Candidatus Neomarinimicrobiota bacterium]MBT5776734.1 50S ribosomal protein L23 [Candidatus Neomarinimicrobiota bacterium]MBT6391015.1 50S ribosomal protein L23 [Candidatus Neomarinimicrobiota bacterium]MBT6783151.1 50S ribosomal protein L23 [Candidatus Neomarinimicrobiota bacterium]|tara:strand:- start:15432 stop:15752 length:321 start_codon:yes stop_codon:yes gene_type:complete
MSYQKIIVRPLFTEKMSRLEEEERKYAFQVEKGVNKIEIKRAIEGKFDVEVEKVATMNRAGKEKNMTVRSGGKTIRTQGFRSSWKKAVVTLKEGDVIDLLRGDTAE